MKKLLSIIAILSLVFSPVTPAFAADATWTGLTDDTWADNGNWSAAFPIVGNTATFDETGAIPAGGFVDLEGAATVGDILFDNQGGGIQAYVIGGGTGVDTLTLDDSGAGASIIVDATVDQDQTIDADVVLAEDTTVTNNSLTNQLIFSGVIDGTTAGTENLAITSAAGGVTLAEIGTTTALGSLTITASGVTTLNGNITTDNSIGTGNVDLSGAAGTIILGAAFTDIDTTNGGGSGAPGGNIDLSGSAVTMGADTTLTSGTGNVTLGAVDNNTFDLTIDSDGTTTITGIISNTGALNLNGTGTTTLNAVNAFTGITTLNAGTLTIGTGGDLGGGNVTHAAASTFSIGLNTVNVGAYTMDGTSTLMVSIDGTTHGSIVGTGAATVNAGDTVQLSVANFVPNGATYTIVNGTGGAGVAAPIIQVTGDTHATFSATTVGSSLILTPSRSSNGFASNGSTVGGSNAQAAGAVLDAIQSPSGDMQTVLNTLDNESATAAGNAIATMTPDVSSGIMQASQQIASQFIGTVSNRLGYARSGLLGVATGDMLQGMGFWVQGMGSNLHQDARKGIQGFNANVFGTSLGADKLVDNHVRVGVAGNYGFGKVHSKTPGSPSDDINSWGGTIYGSYDSTDLCKSRHSNKNSRTAVRNQLEDNWYVDGMVNFTENEYDSRREIWLTPTNARVAKADHHGQTYTSQVESGYTFVFEETKNLETTPFASLAYSYFRMNKYKEAGADALNLTVNGEGYNQLLQTLGTKFAYPFISEKAGTFIPAVKAAWVYDYIGDRFETTASFAGGGSSFNTKGAKPAKSGLLLGGELAFLNKGNMTLTGNYDMELKDEFIGNTYYGTARFDF